MASQFFTFQRSEFWKEVSELFSWIKVLAPSFNKRVGGDTADGANTHQEYQFWTILQNLKLNSTTVEAQSAC